MMYLQVYSATVEEGFPSEPVPITTSNVWWQAPNTLDSATVEEDDDEAVQLSLSLAFRSNQVAKLDRKTARTTIMLSPIPDDEVTSPPPSPAIERLDPVSEALAVPAEEEQEHEDEDELPPRPSNVPGFSSPDYSLRHPAEYRSFGSLSPPSSPLSGPVDTFDSEDEMPSFINPAISSRAASRASRRSNRSVKSTASSAASKLKALFAGHKGKGKRGREEEEDDAEAASDDDSQTRSTSTKLLDLSRITGRRTRRRKLA